MITPEESDMIGMKSGEPASSMRIKLELVKDEECILKGCLLPRGMTIAGRVDDPGEAGVPCRCKYLLT